MSAPPARAGNRRNTRAAAFMKKSKKKRYPEGYLFSLRLLLYSVPRQEPGRYFLSRSVPVAPHSQPYRPWPMLPPAPALAAAVPEIIGISVTSLPSTVPVAILRIVAVILPLTSVDRLATYFELTGCALPVSPQPHISAPGAVPPV